MDSPRPQPAAASAGGQEALQLREELAVETVRADFGELARPLIHEFNNFLNNIVLSFAVIEQAGGDTNTGLARLRRQADQVTNLIKEFHEYRGRKAPPAQPVDLNQALRRAADALAGESPLAATESGAPALPVTFDLAADIHPVRGAPSDLMRLGYFLLKNAIQALQLPGSCVRVETSQLGEQVALRIDLPGLRIPAELQSRSLESLSGAVRGFAGLELAACTSIARRSRGKFRVESPPEGGLHIVLEMPVFA
jgi:signal transduction histidine kinase